MAIRFPKMHVATSVVNRILNISDELETAKPRQVEPQEPAVVDTVGELLGSMTPAVPDPTQAGQQLDLALGQPPAQMPPLSDDPASATAAAVEPILQGGTALEGLVGTISEG